MKKNSKFLITMVLSSILVFSTSCINKKPNNKISEETKLEVSKETNKESLKETSIETVSETRNETPKETLKETEETFEEILNETEGEIFRKNSIKSKNVDKTSSKSKTNSEVKIKNVKIQDLGKLELKNNKVNIPKSVNVFYTAQDALTGHDVKGIFESGKYYVFKYTNNAINISKKPNTAGGWIKATLIKPTNTDDVTNQDEITKIDDAINRDGVINSDGSTNIEKERQIFLNKINYLRKQYGLSEVQYHPIADKVANIRAKEIVHSKKFSHIRPNSYSSLDMDSYPEIKFKRPLFLRTENLGLSSKSESFGTQAFNLWLNSTGHKENMLNPDTKYIGLGYEFAKEVYFKENTSKTYKNVEIYVYIGL